MEIGPGAGPDEEKLRPPLKLHELLVADFSTGELYEEQIDWQATMFQPVGGMDRIPYAFAKSLGSIVRYGSPVKQLRKTEKGVHVVYTDGASKATQTVEADYCICTLPITILDTLDTDFSPAKKQAFKGMKVASLYKIGWESPRFWEKKYNIYGGISFTKQTVGLVWYPSWKLFSKTGVILSGFDFEQQDWGDGAPTAVRRAVDGRQARCVARSCRDAAPRLRAVAGQADLCFVAEDSLQPGLLRAEWVPGNQACI